MDGAEAWEYEVQSLFADLASDSEATRIAALNKITDLGETAGEMGLASGVVERFGPTASPAETKAALRALGKMGKHASRHFQPVILDVWIHHQDNEIAATAARALGFAGECALPHAPQILHFAKAHPAAIVQAAAYAALGGMNATMHVVEVEEGLKSQAPEIVAAACGALAALGEPAARASTEVGKHLTHQSPDVKVNALTYFITMSAEPTSNAAAICKCLDDDDALVRATAVEAATRCSPKEVAGILSSGSGAGKCAAAVVLAAMGESAASHAGDLAALLTDNFADTGAKSLTAACIMSRAPPAMRQTKCAAAEALGRLGVEGGKFAEKVAALLNDANAEVRASAACGLGGMGSAASSHETALLGSLNDADARVVAAGALALGKLGRAGGGSSLSVIEAVLKLLPSLNVTVRASACEGLGDMGESVFLYEDKFIKCAEDRCPQVRASFAVGLGKLGHRAGVYAPDLGRMLYDADARVRISAVEALPHLGERGAVLCEDVAESLGDPDAGVRAAACKSLGLFGAEAEPFRQLLEQMSQDPSAKARKAAEQALGMLSSS